MIFKCGVKIFKILGSPQSENHVLNKALFDIYLTTLLDSDAKIKTKTTACSFFFSPDKQFSHHYCTTDLHLLHRNSLATILTWGCSHGALTLLMGGQELDPDVQTTLPA